MTDVSASQARPATVLIYSTDYQALLFVFPPTKSTISYVEIRGDTKYWGWIYHSLLSSANKLRTGDVTFSLFPLSKQPFTRTGQGPLSTTNLFHFINKQTWPNPAVSFFYLRSSQFSFKRCRNFSAWWIDVSPHLIIIDSSQRPGGETFAVMLSKVVLANLQSIIICHW